MNAKQIIRKRNIVLVGFLLLTAVFVVAITLVFIRVKDYNMMTLINIVLVFTLTLISLLFRSTLYGYNNMVRIARVVLNQAKPVSYSKNIAKYTAPLIDKGYTLYTTNETYSLYYLHTVDERIKVKKIWQVSIILILKKQDTDFYDKNLHNEIAKLESTFQKREFPQKYMIIAFKEFDTMDDKAIHDIGEVVSYRTNRHSYTQINVGMAQDSKKAYFLYSNTYYPTYYYKDAVDLIFELIGTKRMNNKSE